MTIKLNAIWQIKYDIQISVCALMLNVAPIPDPFDALTSYIIFIFIFLTSDLMKACMFAPF